MLALRDIMTREVVHVTPDTPINDVVSILSTESITGVPVVSFNRVVGVISASDIVEFAGRSEVSLESPVENRDEIDAELEHEIEAEMSVSEIEEAEIADQYEDSSDDEYEVFEEFTAGDLMTRKLCSLPSSTPLDRAAREMVRTGVHRLLVMDDNKLVGIATSMDFLRAVAQGQLR
ncbi:MAG TPA: CBS domain-containing protein [Longimicrobiales bacterium]|nr:CBS domain-containing protein [Longimicrobiales bacterium]